MRTRQGSVGRVPIGKWPAKSRMFSAHRPAAVRRFLFPVLFSSALSATEPKCTTPKDNHGREPSKPSTEPGLSILRGHDSDGPVVVFRRDISGRVRPIWECTIRHTLLYIVRPNPRPRWLACRWRSSGLGRGRRSELWTGFNTAEALVFAPHVLCLWCASTPRRRTTSRKTGAMCGAPVPDQTLSASEIPF